VCGSVRDRTARFPGDNSQIFKFSNDGKKLLLTLGEKEVIKSDETHFGRCANIAFLPAYPVWATIIIALDVLAIYALAVHGREVQY